MGSVEWPGAAAAAAALPVWRTQPGAASAGMMRFNTAAHLGYLRSEQPQIVKELLQIYSS